jgi:hypothetical protein
MPSGIGTSAKFAGASSVEGLPSPADHGAAGSSSARKVSK